MLSVSNVSAGAAASGYYSTEGYYAAGSPEAEAAAQWFGRAAEYLAAKGQLEFTRPIDDLVFADLLDGRAPPTEKNEKGEWRQGQVLGRWVDGGREHRPGIDLTFSASKSVSIMALVAKDDRIIAAHDAAVRAAMTWIEANAVATRRAGPDGDIEVVQGGKIIAGLFRHDTSRALDPQLHSHAVIANMVLNPDGKWTALHNDEIYLTKMLGGEIYRNELARGLRGLGYEVDRSGKDGIVEIKGVPPALLSLYSKRSEAIEAALAKRGLDDSPENRALAALATRVAKGGNLDRAALHDHWLSEAKAQGMAPEQLQDLRRASERSQQVRLGGFSREGVEADFPKREAKEALAWAVAHLSERQSVYPLRDLLKAALPRLTEGSIGDLSREVTVAMKDKSLLYAGKSGLSPLLTDRETLATEREVLKTYRSGLRSGKLDLSGLSAERRDPERVLVRYLEDTTLTEGQRDAVRVGLTGTSQIVGVQGYAGTGKTFMVESLHRYAEKAGYELIGLAPSGRAVEALKEAIPAAQTMQSWLMQIRQGGDPSGEGRGRKILVVDEAGMIAATEMRDLLTHAHRSGFARVILVGDVKQLDAVSAGQPFAQLQRAGMPTALMTDIQRQRDEAGREAVLHAIRGEVKAAMARIGEVAETGNRAEIATHVADCWLRLDAKGRAETGIAVLTNAARQSVNEVIRTTLKLEGHLGVEDHSFLALKPAGLTRAAAGDARSYSTGDILLPLATSRQHGVEKGDLYIVLQTDLRANTVTVEDVRQGRALTLPLRQDAKLAASLVLYVPEERSFAAGERVRFTIADKDSQIVNGTRGVIRAIGDDSITVTVAGRDPVSLPLAGVTARGLDHAYASTVVGLSSAEQLATQKSFYVAISRMREEALLVTDDAAALANRIEANTGDRPTALESWLKAERDRLEKQKAEAQTPQEKAAPPDRSERERDVKGPKATLDQDRSDRAADYAKLFSLPIERTDAEVAQTLKAFEERQKQKTIEGPIR
jgi:conjugative relaxase-like TrwC/TraI family protein